MKKIILMLMFLGFSSLMANEALQLDKKVEGTSFIFNDTFLLVYQGEKYDKEPKDKEVLLGVLKNMVCKDDNIKKALKQGKKLIYLYVHKDKYTSVYIDSCN